MRILIISDDLTGACDAAAPFASRGRHVEVRLASDLSTSNADVLAVSTDSRNISRTLARTRLARILSQRPQRSRSTIFKKIDSVCRGNTFAEISRLVSEFPRRLMFLTPAFPSLGRSVRSGYLHLKNSEKPLNISVALTAAGVPHSKLPASSSATDLRDLVDQGERIFLCDASTDAELTQIVDRAMALNRELIWVGSGGLTRALATRLGGPTRYPLSWEQRNGALMFCIGSNHPASARQIEHMVLGLRVPCFSDANECAKALPNLLNKRSTLIWRVAPGLSPRAMRAILKRVCQSRMTTMLLSGGDTASSIYRSLSAKSIAIGGELMPGIPWGTIRGGEADRMRVVTKSGGFGGDAALTAITRMCTRELR